jgi:hypothetical protein
MLDVDELKEMQQLIFQMMMLFDFDGGEVGDYIADANEIVDSIDIDDVDSVLLFCCWIVVIGGINNTF